MTVKQLKEFIQSLPDSMDVCITEKVTEFQYGLVGRAYTKEIKFTEDPDDKESLTTDVVLILEE